MSHWSRYASQWSAVRPPLRPGDHDLERYGAGLKPGQTVVVLGVTPELVNLAVDCGCDVWAIDNEPSMIERFEQVGANYYLGDWTDLPSSLPKADWVLADGAPLFFRDLVPLCSALESMLKATGQGVMRVFCRLDSEDSPKEIIRHAADYPNFHEFKWRYAMAVARAEGIGVERLYADLRDLNGAAWAASDLATLDVYKHSSDRYFFHPINHVSQSLERVFDQVSFSIPDYPLGSRCPIFSFSQPMER